MATTLVRSALEQACRMAIARLKASLVYAADHPENPHNDAELEYAEDGIVSLVTKDLNGYAAECHQDNMKWWISLEDGVTKLKRNKGELIALMHSELSEALEGERKNLNDDKLPHRKMAEVELVDALIRIFDYAAAFGYDLQGAYEEKRAFNAAREDHKHEARKIAGGKQF